MITLTRVYTRPNKTTVWHSAALNTAAMRAHIQTAYIDTGKLISQSSQMADLTYTFTMVWRDQAAFEEYDQDPMLLPFWEERDQYNSLVGITKGPKVFS